MKVLFVCTGNTCRSPMAEAIFNDMSLKNKLQHSAKSRGISVFFEEPINPKAAEALNILEITAGGHISKMICEEDVKSSDLILTMTAEHKMLLKSKFPKYSSKIYTLNEKAYGKDKPISDPYGQSQQIYTECAREIEAAVAVLIEKL